MSKEIVVAITGASGMPYTVTLLQNLEEAGAKVHLVASKNGRLILEHETGRSLEDLSHLVTKIYQNDDLSAPISSGGVPFDGMVIVPCSMNTLAKTAVGVEDSLITRLATVSLKEKRTLIFVPRETPLSDIHLESMARLSRSGAVIMPAMPGFYNKPTTIDEMVEFMVGRILDHLGVEHEYPRWAGD